MNNIIIFKSIEMFLCNELKRLIVDRCSYYNVHSSLRTEILNYTNNYKTLAVNIKTSISKIENQEHKNSLLELLNNFIKESKNVTNI